MCGLLIGTRLVVDGLANNDMKAVAAAARAQGMHVMQDIPGPLKAKLPMEFKQLGMSMHGGFDRLAMDAESMGDPKHALQQMTRFCSSAWPATAVNRSGLTTGNKWVLRGGGQVQ